MKSVKNFRTFRPDFFYELIYAEFFSNLGSGMKKKTEKSSENDWLFSELFFFHFQSLLRF